MRTYPIAVLDVPRFLDSDDNPVSGEVFRICVNPHTHKANIYAPRSSYVRALVGVLLLSVASLFDFSDDGDEEC